MLGSGVVWGGSELEIEARRGLRLRGGTGEERERGSLVRAGVWGLMWFGLEGVVLVG